MMNELVLADGDRVAVKTGAAHYHTDIVTAEHTLTADEPVVHGGTGHGPTAYDLLLAAIGSCTSITLRMYADRKGWDVGDITVRLKHSKTHATDIEDCDKELEGRIDLIEREIEFSNDLDQAQLDRLMYIAEKCPVHKTINGPVCVLTDVAVIGGP